MNDLKAKAFVAALDNLCHQHGVMLWTALQTVPIMASNAQDDDDFHYEMERPEIGNSIIVRRVLK